MQPAAETAAAQGGWPPAGWVDQAGAAERMEISPKTLRDWVADGSLSYLGAMAIAPDRRRRRIYELAALDEARERMRAALAARATLPEGYISRDETAAMLGIGPDTLALWHTNGKLRCGMWVKTVNGKRAKIYPRGEVERLRDEMAAADQAGIPDGFVDRDGARRMFGVCMMTLSNWERAGKIQCGRLARRGSRNRPYKLYAIEDLRPLVEALRGADAVYRTSDRRLHVPAGFVNADEAARLFGVTKAVLTRWERDGQIACGERHTGQGIRTYPLAQLERLVAECGRYSPPYPDPDRPGVCRVPLGGHEMKRREAIIDAADVELLEGRSCHWHTEEGVPEHLGQVVIGGTTTRLHQLVLGLRGSEWKVGHLNGDPLDCRRENLVVRTRSECGANMRKARSFCGRPPTSRFKGVCWDKRREKWKAYIKRDQVMRNIGHFGDEIAAAQAYDEAARELFGEHARLNFPDGIDAFLAADAAETRGDDARADFGGIRRPAA